MNEFIQADWNPRSADQPSQRSQFATQGAEEPPRRHVTLTGLDQDDAAAAAQAG